MYKLSSKLKSLCECVASMDQGICAEYIYQKLFNPVRLTGLVLVAVIERDSMIVLLDPTPLARVSRNCLFSSESI